MGVIKLVERGEERGEEDVGAERGDVRVVVVDCGCMWDEEVGWDGDT